MQAQAVQPCAQVEQKENRRIEQRHGKIAKLAYFLWCCGGCRNGYADTDWRIAEHIFDTASFRTGGRPLVGH